MPPKKTPAPEGEVVLVNKPEEKPAPAIKEITPTQYNALKPKKELSEKQQANLAKLIERNKERAKARHAVVSEAIPEVVPEDKVLVKVKPKRQYNKKPKNEVIQPSPAPSPAPSEPSTETETESEPEPEPRKVRTKKPVAPKRAPKPKAEPKPVKKYRYDTETSDSSDDSDEDYEDHKVQKYAYKAQRRLEAVKHIDNRLKELNSGNPYAARNLSLF
jgi:hypothetical protein